MIDRYTRWPEAVPLKDTLAETVAKTIFDTWITRFGVPARITSDRGPQFYGRVMEQLNHLLGAQHIATTSYHPQANGIIERWHQRLKYALRCAGQNWLNALPAVML